MRTRTVFISRHAKSTGGRRRLCRGVMLIEALVGILIFAIGVLGVVGLQASMTRAQSSAKFRGDASYLASELVGAMWADIPHLSQYQTANCAGYQPCTDWKNKMTNLLPGGTMEVTVDASQVVTIKISWTTPEEGAHNYLTSVGIQS